MSKEESDLRWWLRMTYQDRVHTEFRFHPTRKWRFDWALPDIKVGIEFDGVVSHSAHTSITNVLNDSAKMNEAALLGWIVIRVNTPSLRDGTGYEMIERAVAQRQLADAATGGQE